MTRDEFVERLGELLACLPADQVEESKEFYAEAIADRMEDGMSEEEAVAAVGSPQAVAEAILDDLPAVPRAIAKTRRKGNAVLWALAILGSPLWIVLALGFAAVAVMVYISIWVLAACVWIITAGLGAVGAAAFVLATTGIAIGHAPFVLAMTGVGFAFIGATLLLGAGAWAVTKQIARLSVLWVKKALSPFRKDRGRTSGGTGGSLSAEPHAGGNADSDGPAHFAVASPLN